MAITEFINSGVIDGLPAVCCSPERRCCGGSARFPAELTGGFWLSRRTKSDQPALGRL